MSFDFPASPTEGQIYTPAGGPTYIYYNPSWRILPSGGTVPTGAVEAFARSTPPEGWLRANGATISRTVYSALFAISGGGALPYGPGDGVNTFDLPDMRAEFIRGWDDSRGVDVSRVFGSAQAEAFKNHAHGITINNNGTSHQHAFSDTSSSTSNTGAHVHAGGGQDLTRSPASNVAGSCMASGKENVASAGAHAHTVAVSGTTGNVNAWHTHGATVEVSTDGGIETRPRNVALLVCIKY